MSLVESHIFDKNPFIKNERVLVITGPTASGKSSIAELLAYDFNCEIISADSRQIYQKLDIGTAKPGKEVSVPYQLIDIIDTDQRYDAASFAKDAEKLIFDIKNREKTPLIAGGTGFYIRALTCGIFTGKLSDEKIRAELSKRLDNGEDLYSILLKEDPIAAEKIHPNNKVRLIRALEVFFLTGKPISWHWENSQNWTSEHTYLKVALRPEREYLRERIFARTKLMLQNGWIDEVNELIQAGIDINCPGFESVGYREICEYLKNKLTLDELETIIAQKTWQYARRQMMWFKKEPNIHFIDIEKGNSSRMLASQIIEIYQNST